MKVDTILSVFRLLLWLLKKSQDTHNEKADKTNREIQLAIVRREQAVSEAARAASAQRKLNDIFSV
jgi:hypothetical protein